MDRGFCCYKFSSRLCGWLTGLVHAILNEKQSCVVVAALKALSLLVAATPYVCCSFTSL